jgi:hypothetical protein
MTRKLDEIIADFDLFCIEGDYIQRLSKLTDELLATSNPEKGLKAMLRILERFPEEELGSPGPLIYAIEHCKGYEIELLQSLKRQPTSLSIWLLYRLIQKKPEQEYVEVLQSLLIHPRSTEQMKEDIELILGWLGISST